MRRILAKVARDIQLILLLLFTTGCTQLFYQPSSRLYSDPAAAGINFENVYFESSDGVRLHGWFFPQASQETESKGLILFFHGNAQNITSHYLNFFWILEKGWDFFIFDYRGYGLSEGKASQQGVHKDGLAALKLSHKWMQEKNYPKFVVYAQSLGGTIAARSLQDDPKREEIDLIVFDSTFPSYQRIARNKLKSTGILSFLSPLIPVLISDEYSPDDFYQKITNPVLVVHGQKDNVVEYQYGEEIFGKLQTQKKWFWSFEEGGHIDVFFSNEGKNRDRFLDLVDTL